MTPQLGAPQSQSKSGRHFIVSVAVPEGSIRIETVRIVCRENGPFSYLVESEIVSPDGETLYRQAFNAEEAQAKAAKLDDPFKRFFGKSPMPRLHEGYHSNYDSLVCWAAARKCEGTEYRWPPPPNKMQLEYSERALKMRLDYDRPFVPHCRL